MKIFLFLTFIIVLMSSCTSDSESDLYEPISEDLVTYAQVKLIIDNNCIVCHGSVSPSGNLSLTNYQQIRDAVENGNVIDRITRNDGDPLLMPTTGKMSQLSINTIIKWKDDGYQE